MKATTENFINALAIYNGGTIEEVNRIADEDSEIVETSETLEDFISERGKVQDGKNTEFGEVCVWNNIQRAKGLRRGSLYIVCLKIKH